MPFNLQSILNQINQVFDDCCNCIQTLFSKNIVYRIEGIDCRKVLLSSQTSSITCLSITGCVSSNTTVSFTTSSPSCTTLSPSFSISFYSEISCTANSLLANKSAVYLFLTSDSDFLYLTQALPSNVLEDLNSVTFTPTALNSGTSNYYVVYAGETGKMQPRFKGFTSCFKNQSSTCGHTFGEKLKILFTQPNVSRTLLELYLLVFYVSVSNTSNASCTLLSNQSLQSLLNEHIRKSLETCFIAKWKPIFNFIEKKEEEGGDNSQSKYTLRFDSNMFYKSL